MVLASVVEAVFAYVRGGGAPSRRSRRWSQRTASGMSCRVILMPDRMQRQSERDGMYELLDIPPVEG
jgi:hypothetical protein